MIAQLTGVRALAAMWVVFGHFREAWTTLFPSLRPLLPLMIAADLGVDLFFGLSGFILAYNYLEQFQTVSLRPYCHFLGMRLARIYPVHLFTLLTLLAGVGLGQVAHLHFNMPERLTFPQFVENIFLVQAWVIPWGPSWNGPAWSISAEWFAYLLFPFLAFAVVRLRSVKVALAGALLPLALLFALYVSPVHGVAHPLLRIACEFTSGVFLYKLYERRWLSNLPWPAIALGLMAVTVAAIFLLLDLGYKNGQFPATPLVVLFVFALANARTGIGWFMSLPPMVFLGEASYSLYMTHGVIRLMVVKLLPFDKFAQRSWEIRVAAIATYLLMIAAAAIMTYLIVEVPGRRAMRQVLDRMIPLTARQPIRKYAAEPDPENSCELEPVI